MTRKLTVLAIAGAVLLAGTAVASTAFTSATVQRSASFTVADDTNAIIDITAGTVGGTTTTNGKLQVNLSNLNKDASFTFGNTTDPSQAYVFKFENTDSQSHSFTVSVSGIDATFYIMTPSGTVLTVTKGGTSSSFTLASNEVAYVAVKVTTGTSDGSGTVTIDAS